MSGIFFYLLYLFIWLRIKMSLSRLYLIFKNASVIFLWNVSESLGSLGNVFPGSLDGWDHSCDHTGFQFLSDYCSLCLPASEFSLSSSHYIFLLWSTLAFFPAPINVRCSWNHLTLSIHNALWGWWMSYYPRFEPNHGSSRNSCLKGIKFRSLCFTNCISSKHSPHGFRMENDFLQASGVYKCRRSDDQCHGYLG